MHTPTVLREGLISRIERYKYNRIIETVLCTLCSSRAGGAGKMSGKTGVCGQSLPQT